MTLTKAEISKRNVGLNRRYRAEKDLIGILAYRQDAKTLTAIAHKMLMSRADLISRLIKNHYEGEEI